MKVNKKNLDRVIDAIHDMWKCNIDNGNLEESFDGWCEDGDIFDNEECIKIMKHISPYVDALSYKMQKELE